MIYLDTNVVAELVRDDPDATVAAWVSSKRIADVGTTAVTVAEVRYGIALLPDGHRKDGLSDLTESWFADHRDRIAPFDQRAAAWYATIRASRDRQGRPMGPFDAQIAAICQSESATLATRNTRDFDLIDLHLVNPWLADSD